MAAHPKGHNCPDNQHYDEERGRCVDNEMNEYSEDPNSRSKASPSLTFRTHKKRGEIKKI